MELSARGSYDQGSWGRWRAPIELPLVSPSPFSQSPSFSSNHSQSSQYSETITLRAVHLRSVILGAVLQTAVSRRAVPDPSSKKSSV